MMGLLYAMTSGGSLFFILANEVHPLYQLAGWLTFSDTACPLPAPQDPPLRCLQCFYQ